MSTSTEEHPSELVKESLLYKEFLAEREKALLDWIVKHRSSWRNNRLNPSAG
jgi:hypothetical protein